jgi:hypothetical protein
MCSSSMPKFATDVRTSSFAFVAGVSSSKTDELDDGWEAGLALEFSIPSSSSRPF